MRKFACTVALAVSVVALASQSAWSQSAATIKIVVPYPAGGVGDTLARLLVEQIGRTQGPILIVENRSGGNSVIGTEAVARAAPDGNTALLTTNAFVVNPQVRKV